VAQLSCALCPAGAGALGSNHSQYIRQVCVPTGILLLTAPWHQAGSTLISNAPTTL
jgi:hypothetical protein